jgi:hypothetical protein
LQSRKLKKSVGRKRKKQRGSTSKVYDYFLLTRENKIVEGIYTLKRAIYALFASVIICDGADWLYLRGL